MNEEADTIASIQRCEERALLNFAPPDLERLGQPFQRPRATYVDFRACDEPDQLCRTCGSIDLLALFRDGLHLDCSGPMPVEKGIPLGYSDQVYANAGCPFCRLVVDIGDTNFPGDEREVEFWSLKTVSGYEVMTAMERSGDSAIQVRRTIAAKSAAIYLAVVRSVKSPPGYGFEYRTIVKDSIYIGLQDQEILTGRTEFRPRLQDPQRVSFEIIKDWLHQCDSHEICKHISPPSGCGLSLKVLDAKNLHVIDLPQSSSYIALSYVLGSTRSLKQRNIYTLSDLPCFYQDAIAIVKALNHRYIWTDYICIDNTDSPQRALDIERMGTIYRQAYATIVNAAAGDAREGIPGINGTDRSLGSAQKKSPA
jgi:Heterokaryon incompatibility protein (HET)